MDFHTYMVLHMKTTLNIPDPVMQRLREEAARRGTTMSSLVEAGLRLILAESGDHSSDKELPPLPRWHGGRPLVDITDREALGHVLNAERDERLYGVRPAGTSET